MAEAPPSFSFVAFPPATEAGRVVFGKNSIRPKDEVQEVMYFPAATHEPGEKVQCTYIAIDQSEKTSSVVLSKPAWLWGAEMGANEHGVCIANGPLVAREPAAHTEALLGMDLVRLGLERGSTAKEVLDCMTSLLEEHGQGGNYYEDGSLCLSFHSAFLIVDRVEAWVLETVGKYWAAEKVTEGIRGLCHRLSICTKIDAEHPELRSYAQAQGWWSEGQEFNFSEVFSSPEEEDVGPCAGRKFLEKHEGSITVQTMIDNLRGMNGTVCADSDTLLPTGSMVSVLPQSSAFSGIHFFTATPDPVRSIFKPFIFVADVKPVPKAQSPCFEKQPGSKTKVDWRHELYKAHEWALTVIDSAEEEGQKLQETMLDLEKQGLDAMEDILSSSDALDASEVEDLFYDCVDTEIKFYK
ncbi:secernin-1 isoform X1 [Amia ocellicauda]|uniref:secernin-1 isoform X1 n=1 Tax=Amia ocellicauda TaxID=2972642 RepID=UPI0034649D7E